MARAPGNYDGLRDAQRRALEPQTAPPGQNQVSPEHSTPQIDSGARAEARPHETRSRPPGYFESLRDDQQAAQSPSATNSSEQRMQSDRIGQIKPEGLVAGGWPPESQSRGDQEAWAAQRHKELNQPLQQKFRDEINAQNKLLDASNIGESEQTASQSKQGEIEKAAAIQRAWEKAKSLDGREDRQISEQQSEKYSQSQER